MRQDEKVIPFLPSYKRMDTQFYVYIMSNKYNKVLYTGITSNLISWVYQYKAKDMRGFTRKYNGNKLVYYGVFEDAYSAIQGEKQIKAGSRQKKVELITGMNPSWKDLYESL